MALMDSLLNAAMSAIGNQNGEGGQQNAALGMLMELVQQNGGIGNLMASCNKAAWAMRSIAGFPLKAATKA